VDFCPQRGAYFFTPFLQDADKSGDLDFTEVSMLVPGNQLIMFRCYFSLVRRSLGIYPGAFQDLCRASVTTAHE
jgi:hypothetical protein